LNDDGVMTALEVAALDLSNADLVVLSACETGLGKVAGGEGVLGLQRAFQTAGARTTVTSLWKVSDEATRALMTEFYRNLWEKKLSRIESLRQAQLTMLNRYDDRAGTLRSPGPAVQLKADAQAAKSTRDRTPPAYWAAFVLAGDWR
jgi:CHAT domain-containing protein